MKKVLFPVDSSLEAILVSGGDDRLELDENLGLNGYCCSPKPDTACNYSYTTASSISMSAYLYCQSVYFEMQKLSECEEYDIWATKKFREFEIRLKKIFEIGDKNQCIFGASGTDLELLALSVAHANSGKKVHNIVVGLEEVGSGIKYVSEGLFYKNKTVLGNDVKVGDKINGFDTVVEGCTFVDIRSKSGDDRSSEDMCEEIKHLVHYLVSEKIRPLIHIVHRSKTGIIAPNINKLIKILNRYDGCYDIVVDACQGRISPRSINSYLEKGAIVIFTGSKFFGGPPFSGVIILPENHFSKDMQLPSGLSNFFTENEFVEKLVNVKKFSSDKVNLGLILRWEAALYEIERFFSIPLPAVDKVVNIFNEVAFNFFKKSDFFEILDSNSNFVNGDDFNSLDVNPIFTIGINNIKNSKYDYDFSLASQIYNNLNKNITMLISSKDKILSSFLFRAGQPVKSHPLCEDTWVPTLRVSLGAPLISDLFFLSEEKIALKFLKDFEMLESKADLITRYFY